jgi:tetratricopeptide (TPR) repeat protein
MRDVLLGDGHAQLVRDLRTRLDRLVAGDVSVPRVVVLEGASGTGKSRVIRELYRSLQSTEPEPAYWPPLPEHDDQPAPGGAGADPLPDRKRLGPPVAGFVWPADALPSYGWWVLDCARMPRGDLLDVISQAQPSIEAHLLPIRLAWRESAGWPARVRASRSQLIARAKEAIAEGGLAGVDQLLGSLDLAVPGLGLGVSWLSRGATAVSAHRSQQVALHTDVQLTGEAAVANRQSAAAELAGTITQVAHPKVPAVVVIEDMHLMGADLDDFLTVAAQRQPDHPVLVIGTAWPEGHANPAYARWRGRTDQAGNLERWRMPTLDEHDLSTLLRRYAPATDAQVAEAVVARYANPLALQLYLTLEDTQDQINECEGALDVSQDDLAELPDSIRGLYSLRWRELPAVVRTALSYVAGTLPAQQYGWTSTTSLVAAAVEEAGLACGTDPIGVVLGEAVEPYAWLVDEGAGRFRFRETVLGGIAYADLSKAKRSALRTAIRNRLRAAIDDLRGSGIWILVTEENLHTASWLMTLTPDAPISTPADSAAAILVARANALAHHPAEAAHTLQSRDWQAPLDPDHPDTLTTRSHLASWVAGSGRVAEGVGQFEQLLADQQRVFGPQHPDTFSTRNNLARWLAESGRVTEAIDRFEQLLADQQQVLDPDDPDVLLARHNLASWLAESGRLADAIVQLEQLLTAQQRVLDPDHPYILITRNNLATSLASSGRLAEAISQFEQLLTDEQRVLGPERPSTFRTRNNLAFSLGASGRVADAIAQFEQLLADRQRVLGPDHPDTLTTRNNLAGWLAELGRVAEATSQFEQLLADRQRVLGPDHPDTLTTRNNLAARLAEAGQVGEAISQFEQLLIDQQRVLGPDHPSVFVTRNNLARWLAESGQVAEAISQLEQLFIDRQRVLGPDHPDTLATRGNLAYWLDESGQVSDAISELERLLTDRQRVLGPDHPETLITRNNLAASLAESGEIAEAIVQFDQLLTDQRRVLGPDHPNTLAVHGNLARWRAEQRRRASPAGGQ